MTAIGTKRTLPSAQLMSAFGGIADMTRNTRELDLDRRADLFQPSLASCI
jgi:hypothetical protein